MIGKLDEYDVETEEFDSYMERFDQFVNANSIALEKRVAVFLSVIGARTYELLRSIVSPALPKTKTLDQIVIVLKRHFNPKPLVISERFKFHKRDQKENETVTEYIVALRRLSTSCAFGEFLDDALRDRLVCGMKSESSRRKCL